jgi:hypothetical protein
LAVLGALFVLAGLGGAALAVERHVAWSDSMALAKHHLDKEEAAVANGDRNAVAKHALYVEADLSIAAGQSDSRNMYGAGALGGVWFGAAILVLAFRRRALLRPAWPTQATPMVVPFTA